ncbi:hypothetical protein KJ965_06065 [Patescibacteria group bacterium]|nr:hypothetical protein [Patescibacteria group bacterium]
MEIIGWIIWLLVAFLAVSFAFGTRQYAKVRAPSQNATAVQTFFWWVLAVAFLVSDWNKLHLFWAIPAAFFGGQMVGLGAIPLVSPLVLILTRIFIGIILIGVKVPSEEEITQPQDPLDSE